MHGLASNREFNSLPIRGNAWKSESIVSVCAACMYEKKLCEIMRHLLDAVSLGYVS
jgi:hypothetical protein